MTDLSELVRTYEAARASGEAITLSPDDLSLMLQFAALIGNPNHQLPTAPSEPSEDPSERLPRLISIDEIAQHMGITQKTLWRLRKTDPTFPKPVRTSARKKQFVRAEFHDWMLAARC